MPSDCRLSDTYHDCRLFRTCSCLHPDSVALQDYQMSTCQYLVSCWLFPIIYCQNSWSLRFHFRHLNCYPIRSTNLQKLACVVRLPLAINCSYASISPFPIDPLSQGICSSLMGETQKRTCRSLRLSTCRLHSTSILSGVLSHITLRSSPQVLDTLQTASSRTVPTSY